MSLYTASLNSGSNGNCYYIGNANEAVLVDAGISCRETEKRMKRIGLSMDKVKAIFISHEHSDHIAGVRVLSKKYRLPVYITNKTLLNSRLSLDPMLVCGFVAHQPVQIGSLAVTAFPKAHDAADPHSFIVSDGQTTIGVLTDIGDVCDHVSQHFKLCHAVYLEANYDTQMLENGHYPYHLKRRISGGKGHLSNKQALELLKNFQPGFMSHVFLSHLSRDNNDPVLAGELFRSEVANIHVTVASRYEETPVYHIHQHSQDTVLSAAPLFKPVQVSLF
jgi:phosphoribosyl 1,2-cyclic phosphodiesterase